MTGMTETVGTALGLRIGRLFNTSGTLYMLAWKCSVHTTDNFVGQESFLFMDFNHFCFISLSLENLKTKIVKYYKPFAELSGCRRLHDSDMEACHVNHILLVIGQVRFLGRVV